MNHAKYLGLDQYGWFLCAMRPCGVIPGAGRGLSLVLNVEQYQYMSGPHNEIGIQVYPL